jgi:transcription elongation factor GreA
MKDGKTYVTQAGFERLETELDHLKTVRRKEVAERIKTAKEFGDLSENAEYTEAREEQGFVEGRIAELKEMFKDIVLIEEKKSGSDIDLGSRIKIKSEKGDVTEYEIVGSQEADPLGGKISNESPMGKAFIGQKKGALVVVDLPVGPIKYEIVEIK